MSNARFSLPSLPSLRRRLRALGRALGLGLGLALGLGLLLALIAVPTLAELGEPAAAQRRVRRRPARGRRAVRRRNNQQNTQNTEENSEAVAGSAAGGEGTPESAPESPSAEGGASGDAAASEGTERAPQAAAAPQAAQGGAASQVSAAAAGEAQVAASDPGPAPPDLSPLRQEYVALMDELVEARSLVTALGTELFRTRVRVILEDRTRGRQSMARFSARLDGAPIHESGGAVEGADRGVTIFEGAAAPGPHLLSLEVEQRARADEEYRYSQRESFRFQVARERLTELTLILEDDSDIASRFGSDGEGRFELRTRLRVATRALPTGSSATSAAASSSGGTGGE